ncbi:MAG: metallophosphoesterase, partial [Spirochaetaceae bacterium]|nr:metallophosphoesterase [Spirochaetaceae bacterium]
TEIQFIFIDTDRLITGDAEQLDWIDNQLTDSTARWIIVAGHKPLYSYGSHGFNGTLIYRLQPLLDNRADIYIAGHEHDMQILGPINNVYHMVNGSAGETRNTDVGPETIFAASRNGFMVFLFSYNQIICNVVESSTGIIYSQILKEKN